MNKNIVIFSGYALWPTLEYELSLINYLLENNNTVTYIACSGYQDYCVANRGWNSSDNLKFNRRSYCLECNSRRRNAFKKFSYKINVIEIKNIYYDSDNVKKIYSELINNNFSNDEINTRSIHSSLITELKKTTNIYSDTNLVYSLIATGLQSNTIYNKFIKNKKFDSVYLFNGRTVPFGQILHKVQLDGINYYTYEFPFTGYKKIPILPNTAQHDFNAVSQILKDWSYSNPIDTYLVSRYLNSRKKNQAHNFFEPKYINKFDEGDILVDGRRIITFFTSSNYEVHELHTKNNIFNDYTLIIDKILSFNEHPFHLIIREHPNNRTDSIINNVKYSKYKNNINITFIYAANNISSYKILEKSYIVITVGSTIGVEAAASNKPVICLGDSYSVKFPYATNLSKLENLAIVIADLFKKIDSGDYPYEEKRDAAYRYFYAMLEFGYLARQVTNSKRRIGFILNGKEIFFRANLYIRILNRGSRFFNQLWKNLIHLLIN
jgi:hypothetical protein